MSALNLEVSVWLAVIIAYLFVHYVWIRWKETSKCPPGPWGLPIVGYGPFLGETPHETLLKLSKKYGNVFSVYLGPQLHIVVSEFEAAKELLTLPELLTRPPGAFSFLTADGGFTGMNGQKWLEQRRFAIHTLRNLGFGKGHWQQIVQENVDDFVNEMKNWKGKPRYFEGPLTFSQATGGISLLIGRRLDAGSDAKQIAVIQEGTRELMKFISSTGVAVTMPWIRKLLVAGKLFGQHRFAELLRNFEYIFRVELEKRLKNEESWDRDDFIGCYLTEKRKRDLEGKPHTFTEDNLLGSMVVLFMAGNDSTMAGVSWLFLLMAVHQDVQQKVYEEITAALGAEGSVSIEDRSIMPYTWAVVMEMTRWASISAIFPPRHAVRDIKFREWTLPKDCRILCNMWAIMRDPELFDKPEDFLPERFLDSKGKIVHNHPGYAPFSLGKRKCPGDGVAMMTMFLYLVSILQKLKIEPAPGVKPNLEPICNAAMLPKPQALCFIER